jgi:hypothetical protein
LVVVHSHATLSFCVACSSGCKRALPTPRIFWCNQTRSYRNEGCSGNDVASQNGGDERRQPALEKKRKRKEQKAARDLKTFGRRVNEFAMGLRPTHRDESALPRFIDSKRITPRLSREGHRDLSHLRLLLGSSEADGGREKQKKPYRGSIEGVRPRHL